MLEQLEILDTVIPEILNIDESLWNSVFVDYEYPHVERLWLPWNGYRLSLHRILPCEEGQALFHPHPWPQAVKVLDAGGGYEMGIGWGAGDAPPPLACKFVAGSGFRYEMLDVNGWHYVRPIERPSLSIMLTGKPWDRTSPKSSYKLRELTYLEKTKLLEDLRRVV